MKVEDAIKGIVTYRKLIHEENYWNNPERLSDVMAKLAVYNAYLADNIATFHRLTNDKQSLVYKNSRDEGKGVTEAERLAKAETSVERETHERCKYIYTATKDLVTVLQSRLRVIEQQRKDEAL